MRGDRLTPLSNSELDWKLIVPSEHRETVLGDAHCEISLGLLDVEKTYDRIAKQYFWSGAWHDNQDFVRSCQLCHGYKISHQAPKVLMCKRIFERPWMVVDDLMILPRSKNQYK